MEMPADAIQALDVALKHSAADNALCTMVNRNFFFQGSQPSPLGGGVEVCPAPAAPSHVSCDATQSAVFALNNLTECL